MTAGNTRSVARALGGDIVGHDRILVPGPGHSPADRSLQVTLGTSPHDFLVHSFAGDDWRLCRDHVRQRLGLPEWQPGDEQDRRVNPAKSRQFDWSAVDRQAEYRERTEDDLIRINRAVAIWEAAVDPRDTLAERYVREHRKLNLQEDIAKGVLRFHSRCPWRNEDTGKIVFVSALIAAFRSIDDDAITAIHRIRLNPDGSKHSRRMLGIVHRAAVKISGNVDGELAIGEGIESCMAARQLGIQSPCWALGSCGAISFFPVLPDVMTLRILGEIDDANAKAARFCGRRWRRAGRNVVRLLPEIGQDLNDEIIARTGS